MKITLRTRVNQPYQRVWAGFDRTLFERLSPPFPPVEVVRFDGCQKGDLVHLRLNFLFFKQDWISLISDQQETEREIYFIDEGRQLPFFLSRWRHKHRLIQAGEHTLIADELSFDAPNRIMGLLIYPILLAQFAYRKPIYRAYFRS